MSSYSSQKKGGRSLPGDLAASLDGEVSESKCLSRLVDQYDLSDCDTEILRTALASLDATRPIIEEAAEQFLDRLASEDHLEAVRSVESDRVRRQSAAAVADGIRVLVAHIRLRRAQEDLECAKDHLRSTRNHLNRVVRRTANVEDDVVLSPRHGVYFRKPPGWELFNLSLSLLELNANELALVAEEDGLFPENVQRRLASIPDGAIEGDTMKIKGAAQLLQDVAAAMLKGGDRARRAIEAVAQDGDAAIRVREDEDQPLPVRALADLRLAGPS